MSTPASRTPSINDDLGREPGAGKARGAALAVDGPRKLGRLVALERRYDPNNVFRLNHNVPPG